MNTPAEKAILSHCRNTKLCMRQAHDGTCRVVDFSWERRATFEGGTWAEVAEQIPEVIVAESGYYAVEKDYVWTVFRPTGSRVGKCHGQADIETLIEDDNE